MLKIQVYHFNSGGGGGAFSVTKNLLQYSANPLLENHVIYTINKDEQKNFTVNCLKGAASEQVFYYSPRWNFNYTCKKLSRLLPDQNAVLVTNDWLELGMISQLGLQNPVVNFLHGDYEYYYRLATLHQAAVNTFIAVAKNIATSLQKLLPARKDDIKYLRFPVPAALQNAERSNQCNIAFVGRLTAEKGYTVLPLIDERLKQNGTEAAWHIAGEGDRLNWNDSTKVKHYGLLSNEKTIELMAGMDFFVLPSIAEGTPVTLVEAMKAGAVPLVNNIAGGIQELVEDNITGFKINDNEAKGYADRITALYNDKNQCQQIRANCIKKANQLFDPELNTRLIENEFCKAYDAPRLTKQKQEIYGSRLDKKWVPNFITTGIRSL